MSTSSIIVEGLTATIIGMGIVFGVLALLAIILSFFKYLNPKPKEKIAEEQPEINIDTEKTAPAADEDAYESAQDDAELVAVISAALAEYMGEGVVPVIKSIKPVADTGSHRAWNIAAIRENHRGLY